MKTFVSSASAIEPELELLKIQSYFSSSLYESSAFWQSSRRKRSQKYRDYPRNYTSSLMEQTATSSFNQLKSLTINTDKISKVKQFYNALNF